MCIYNHNIILNHTTKYKCFIEYITIIIISTRISCFTSEFVGALADFWILGFLLKYRAKKLIIRIDIKTYAYDIN